MKSNPKNIIKKLLLSSLASVLNLTVNANNDQAAMPAGLPLDFNGESDNELRSAATGTVYRNVLAIKKNGELREIAGHRSHSSHRSHYSSRGGHASHYSHSSHYSSSTSTHYSSSSSASSSYVAPKKTYKDYSLGDRTITRGLYGSDVDNLVTLLVAKRYLKNTAVTQKSGYAMVDGEIESAVKHFQKDSGVSADGKVTSTLAASLKSWDADKTTVPLGYRPISDDLAGNDITELVTLLGKAGFPPDPSKLKTNSYGFYYMSEDISTAIKLFQAYNNLPTTGKADDQTIAKLKAVAK